jgi:DNA-binding NarL/FixJ family response regulator
VRVLVVERRELVRAGARTLLAETPWITRCLVARDGDDAVAVARRCAPHVALVAVDLGAEAGPVVARRLPAVSPMTRTLLLADGPVTALAPAVRAAGAVGVVSSTASGPAIVEAVRRAWLGRAVAVATRRLPAAERVLSAREREVLRHIAGGATNREIADRLALSPHTVKQHASTTFRKLAARNRADAVRRAQQLGLIA